MGHVRKLVEKQNAIREKKRSRPGTASSAVGTCRTLARARPCSTSANSPPTGNEQIWAMRGLSRKLEQSDDRLNKAHLERARSAGVLRSLPMMSSSCSSQRRLNDG